MCTKRKRKKRLSRKLLVGTLFAKQKKPETPQECQKIWPGHVLGSHTPAISCMLKNPLRMGKCPNYNAKGKIPKHKIVPGHQLIYVDSAQEKPGKKHVTQQACIFRNCLTILNNIFEYAKIYIYLKNNSHKNKGRNSYLVFLLKLSSERKQAEWELGAGLQTGSRQGQEVASFWLCGDDPDVTRPRLGDRGGSLLPLPTGATIDAQEGQDSARQPSSQR